MQNLTRTESHLLYWQFSVPGIGIVLAYWNCTELYWQLSVPGIDSIKCYFEAPRLFAFHQLRQRTTNDKTCTDPH